MIHQDFDKTEIHFAPLQGYTDRAYRNAYQILFTEVDYYYSPYLSVDNSMAIDSLDDIQNRQAKLIPQILPGNLAEFKLLMTAVQKAGYMKMNINMGCPYPMVTRKGRGAALINHSELVAEMIDYCSDYSEIDLSLKLRSGIEKENEVFALLANLPLHKIKEIIIHPRTAVQMYKGVANVDIAQKCIELYPKVSFIYNGDIQSFNDYQCKKEQLPEQCKWMLGRGILQNPFLPGQIKNIEQELPSEYPAMLKQFIEVLIQNIEGDSKDSGHALNRVRNQLNYLLNGFPDLQKIKKKVWKSKSLSELKGFIEPIT